MQYLPRRFRHAEWTAVVGAYTVFFPPHRHVDAKDCCVVMRTLGEVPIVCVEAGGGRCCVHDQGWVLMIMCGLEQVVEETVADDDVLMIKGCKSSRAVTVLLRGANDYLLDEMDRSMHDAFCIVKRVLESGSVVPGEPHCCFSHCDFARQHLRTSVDFARDPSPHATSVAARSVMRLVTHQCNHSSVR